MAVQHLGQFLIEKGLVSAEQLARALEKQDPERLLALAVAKGILLQEEVTRLHELYGTSHQKIGEKAVKRGMMTREQLEYLRRSQKNDPVVLRQALVSSGVLTAYVLDEAILQYRESQRRYVLRRRTLPPEMAGRAELVALAGMTEVMFASTLGIPTTLGGPQIRNEPFPARDFTVAMALSGEFKGRFVVTSDARLADIICRTISGVGVPEVSDIDLIDAVGELCNLVVGNAAAALAARGYELKLGPPRPLLVPMGKISLGRVVHWPVVTEFGCADLLIE